MNYHEILEVLNQKTTIEEFTDSYGRKDNLGLGPTVQVERHGGGEGDGELFYVVVFFREHDIYIKFTGSYASYNGIEFYGGWDDCCKEVHPKEIKVTVWE